MLFFTLFSFPAVILKGDHFIGSWRQNARLMKKKKWKTALWLLACILAFLLVAFIGFVMMVLILWGVCRLEAFPAGEKSLFEFAQKIQLGQELLLGHGEEQTGGRERPSVVSDAFEALIAGIYLDGGLEAAQRFVLPFVEEDLTHEAAPFVDYKTRLQEIIQKNPEERVEYVLVSAEGPDHDKKFVVEVHLNSNVIGRGASRSKKGAEQAAAHEALTLMGEE